MPFQDYSPEQGALLPLHVRDVLTEKHLVFLIHEGVERQDLSSGTETDAAALAFPGRAEAVRAAERHDRAGVRNLERAARHEEVSAARAMASVRAPATPSRENSRTAACRMAARVSWGRPREPGRDLEKAILMAY
jgi:hypothetical protein